MPGLRDDATQDTSPTRRRIMAAVPRRDTSPERIVRRLLHYMGYRFRVQNQALPGTPDITLGRRRIAIFVHGCFWHRHPGCSRASKPKSHAGYWEAKFEANRSRDEQKIEALHNLGWRVIVVWECETRSIEKLAERLVAELGSTRWETTNRNAGAK